MSTDSTRNTVSGAGVSRRSIAKGAAWAVPAVLLASPAPALAASMRIDPGINGWVLNTTIAGRGNCSYTLDVNSNPSTQTPTGDGAPYGLYVYDIPTDTNVTINNAKLTYWIIGEQNANVSTLGTHSSCWTFAGRGAAQTKADGQSYRPYTFTYNCTIDPSVQSTEPDGISRVWLGDFHVQFSFSQRRNTCNDVTFWTQRSIDIDGQTFTFERRNGTQGPYNPGGRSGFAPAGASAEQPS